MDRTSELPRAPWALPREPLALPRDRWAPIVALALVLALFTALVPGRAAASDLTSSLPASVLDDPLTWQSLDPAAPAEPGTAVVLDSGVASTRADAVWQRTRGADTVVALIDTGVAPIPALEGAVAGEIDFTGTGGGDGYGHGTFMASLIAGRGPVAPGVAPEAGILSLKVADAAGNTDLGTVLGAMDWLAGPGRGLGIEVAVLALGTEADSAAGEVLDLATERLANLGVLVVTSSGNTGPGALLAPATSPGSVSVGAVDDRTTATRDDDVAADFSADGPDRVGAQQPDLVASGVKVVGAVDPGSVVARENPHAVVGEGLFRGSGTSMATALAGGVAALVSDVRPDLTGEDLAAALTASRELDAPEAVTAAAAMPRGSDTMLRPETATAFAEAVNTLTAERAEALAAVERDRLAQREAVTVRSAALPAVAVQRQLNRVDADAARRSERVADSAERRLNQLERTMLRDVVPAPTTAGWDAASWDSVHWGATAWAAERWQAHDWTPVTDDLVGWDAVLRGVYGLQSVHWGSVHWGSVHWGSVHWGAADWNAATWDAERWESVHWGSVHWGADEWESVHWGSVHWGSVHWGSVHWGADEWAAVHWATSGWNSVHWGSVHWGSVHWGDDGWASVHWGALSTPPAGQWESVHWGSVHWGSVHWGSVHWGSVHWGSVHWGSVHWGLQGA